jgi:hypothetical protein
LAEGIPWNTFIQEFSLINAEKDDLESEPALQTEQPKDSRNEYQNTKVTLQSPITKTNGGTLLSPQSMQGKLDNFFDVQPSKFGNTKVIRISNDSGESDIPDRIVETVPVDARKTLPWSVSCMFPHDILMRFIGLLFSFLPKLSN